jgi:O-antigen ligase
LAIFFFSFLVTFLVANQVSDLVWLKRFTWIFFLVAFFAIIGDALPIIGNITYRFFYYSAKGSLFWTWLTALAFGQAVLNQKLDRLRRLLLAMILIVIFYISFVGNRAWSSGWLPPFIAVVVILWFGVPRARKPLLFLSVIVAAVFASKIYSLVMVGDNQYSLSTRLAAWQLIGEMVRVDPIFGLGPANYYWYTPLFPILGYRVVFNSHNNYVDLIAQTGLVGTVCFIWFSYVVIRLALRLRDHMPDPFARAYVYGVLGGWAGTLVAAALGDWVLPFVYNIGYAGLHASLIGWFFLGGLLVLEKLDRRSGGGEMVVQAETANPESQVL